MTSNSNDLVTIETVQGCLHVRKQSLITNSKYFARMFTVGMVESKTNVVKLNHISFEAVTAIINFIAKDSRQIVEDDELLLEIIENTHLMELYRVFDFYWHLLARHRVVTNLQNFRNICDLVDSYAYDRGMKIIFDILWNNLGSVSDEIIRELNEIQLKEFIKRVKYYPSTDDLVNFLLKWALVNEVERLDTIVGLIRGVDCTSLTENFVKDVQIHPLIVKTHELRRLFSKEETSRSDGKIPKEKIVIRICTYNTTSRRLARISYKFKHNCTSENNWSDEHVWSSSPDNSFGSCKCVLFPGNGDYMVTVGEHSDRTGRNVYSVYKFNNLCQLDGKAWTIQVKGNNVALLRNILHQTIRSMVPPEAVLDIGDYGLEEVRNKKDDVNLSLYVSVLEEEVIVRKPYVGMAAVRCRCFGGVCKWKYCFLHDSNVLVFYHLKSGQWKEKKIDGLENCSVLFGNCDLSFLLVLDGERDMWAYYVKSKKWTKFTGQQFSGADSNFFALCLVDN